MGFLNHNINQRLLYPSLHNTTLPPVILRQRQKEQAHHLHLQVLLLQPDFNADSILCIARWNQFRGQLQSNNWVLHQLCFLLLLCGGRLSADSRVGPYRSNDPSSRDKSPKHVGDIERRFQSKRNEEIFCYKDYSRDLAWLRYFQGHDNLNIIR